MSSAAKRSRVMTAGIWPLVLAVDLGATRVIRADSHNSIRDVIYANDAMHPTCAVGTAWRSPKVAMTVRQLYLLVAKRRELFIQRAMGLRCKVCASNRSELH